MARTTKAAKATEKATKKKKSSTTTKSPRKSPAKKSPAKKSPARKTASKSKTATKKKTAAKKTGTQKTGTKKKTAAKKSSPTKKTASKRTVSQSPPAKKKTGTQKTGAQTTGKKAASSTKSTKTTKTNSRAKKAKSPFDSRFLEQMRKLLKSERDVYERQAKQLRAEADSLVADMDPGDVQFDEESGEGDTIAVERGRDLALASKALEMIDEIDHALSKFDLGTYGICEISGEPIPKERLEAIPWAREKVEYKVGGFGRR